MQQIKCQKRFDERARAIRVKVIKAPFVDTEQLREILRQRARAVVV
ncbi:hypothetical protein KKD84_05020 [Patescibacteria group bacterium]|nr:hypothetical protein [Patescibacteria group bacterium]